MKLNFKRAARVSLLLPTAFAAVFAGCGSAHPAAGGAPSVVAAENFWGSIAAQLAGSRATVKSIVVDPAADPHAYQPTAADARTVATSRLAIVNGVGYDPWASKLVEADTSGRRLVLNVGTVLALRQGDNPHRWYSPTDVQAVADAITAQLKKLDPADASYFDQRRAYFEAVALARFRAALGAIKARYSGVPVGSSESMFALLSPSLGLKLLTPPSYMKAISEGSEPTPADRQTIDRQITAKQIKVWIYNSQNSTPDVQRLTSQARANGIPVVAMTETLSPASETFEQWQTAQLQQLQDALRRASGR